MFTNKVVVGSNPVAVTIGTLTLKMRTDDKVRAISSLLDLNIWLQENLKVLSIPSEISEN